MPVLSGRLVPHLFQLGFFSSFTKCDYASQDSPDFSMWAVDFQIIFETGNLSESSFTEVLTSVFANFEFFSCNRE